MAACYCVSGDRAALASPRSSDSELHLTLTLSRGFTFHSTQNGSFLELELDASADPSHPTDDNGEES